MHTSRWVLSVWVVVALAASGCKKEAPEVGLPPATQEGENTAGCLVDGQPFVAQPIGGGILSAPLPALIGGFSFVHSYYLSMYGKVNGQEAVVMLFFQGWQTGTYALDQDTEYYPQGTSQTVLNHATFRYLQSSTQEKLGTDAHHTGQVVLTKADVPHHLSAGTFSFTAVSKQNPGKTVVITQGRFDRKD